MLGSRWILGSKTIPLFGRALSKRSIFTAARSNTFKRTLGVNSMYAKRNFSAMYYEEMYKKYIQDPNNVTEEWRAYFEGKDTDQNNNSRSSFANINADALAQAIAKKLGNVSKAGSTEDASEVTRILNLVRAYQ